MAYSTQVALELQEYLANMSCMAIRDLQRFYPSHTLRDIFKLGHEPLSYRVIYDGMKHHYVAPNQFWTGPIVAEWVVPDTANQR